MKKFFKRLKRISSFRFFIAWWASISLVKIILLHFIPDNRIIYASLSFIISLLIAVTIMYFDDRMKK